MRAWQAMMMAGGGAGWTPPAGCAQWLSPSQSGAVGVGGAWADASGNGNNATLYGAAFVSEANGLEVDGASGTYADLGNTIKGVLRTDVDHTWAAWIKYSGGNYKCPIVSCYSATISFLATCYNNNFYIDYTYGGVRVGRNVAITPNVWTHIAVRWGADASTFAAYKNLGGFGGGGAWSEDTITGARLGCRRSTLWNFASGLDDVFVFDNLISTDSLADLYNNSPGTHAP